jgi:hypothetical protein
LKGRASSNGSAFFVVGMKKGVPGIDSRQAKIQGGVGLNGSAFFYLLNGRSIQFSASDLTLISANINSQFLVSL